MLYGTGAELLVAIYEDRGLLESEEGRKVVLVERDMSFTLNARIELKKEEDRVMFRLCITAPASLCLDKSDMLSLVKSLEWN